MSSLAAKGLPGFGVGLTAAEVTGAGEVERGGMPMGVAGFSVEGGGDIRLPGVAGLADVDGEADGIAGLNGVGCGEVVAAAGRAGGAAGFDGIGDDGGGNFSATVPAITAGPERESG